jgi:hypothetical protein
MFDKGKSTQKMTKGKEVGRFITHQNSEEAESVEPGSCFWQASQSSNHAVHAASLPGLPIKTLATMSHTSPHCNAPYLAILYHTVPYGTARKQGRTECFMPMTRRVA